jgi:apolipoprotein N-acyltransferase
MVLRWLHALRRRTLLLCVISGLLLALSFPPYHLGFLAFFCLVPFLFALTKRQTEPSFGLGLVMGLALYGSTFFWIAWVTLPGALGAIGLLTVFLGLFTLIFHFVLRRLGALAIWAFPFFWTAMEYLRSLGQLGFPWTSICYSQTEYLPLIQFASLTGPYGVSFWLASINSLVFWSLSRWRRGKYLLLLLVPLLVIPYVYGQGIIPKSPASADFRVALIQPNMGPDIKWDSKYIEHNFEVLIDMTRQTQQEQPDMIIWPETATPCYLMKQRDYHQRVRDLVEELGVPLLTGSPDYAYRGDEEYEYFNSAFFLVPQDPQVQGYTKMQLVPFSEKIPYDEKISLLRRINFGEADFTPGCDHTIFEHPRARFAVLICFESIFPQLAREFHRRGADFLVVITNDGWFGKTPAPYQHAQISIFRAIETRTSIARCANTGVSMIIDPFGRIIHRTPIFVKERVVANLSLQRQDTFYARHGDWLSRACTVVAGLFLILAPLWRRRERPGTFQELP